jgi:hypothetical protein
LLNTVQTPWIQNYPAGVPAHANIGAYRSLTELLESAFRKYAARDALCCMDSRLSFRDLDEGSGAFGAWLQGLNLEPGSRVAIMMPNVPQYMLAMAGILRAGYVVVNVNPLYTARELQHQLKDSGARAIVVLENFAHTLEEVIADTDVQHVVLASIGEMLGFWRGRLIDFALRHVRKMVPEFTLPLDRGRTVTRFAQAQRQIGLAGGEPPTTRGYTPSVFAELPKLLERAGPGVGKGSISAIFSVLVEGSDMEEPVADAVRGILDGHIVLTRALAERNHFPAIDVLQSVSRTVPQCLTQQEWQVVSKTRQLLSAYEDMAELIRLGAYTKGSDPLVDEALAKLPAMHAFLKQAPDEGADAAQSFGQLAAAVS